MTPWLQVHGLSQTKNMIEHDANKRSGKRENSVFWILWIMGECRVDFDFHLQKLRDILLTILARPIKEHELKNRRLLIHWHQVVFTPGRLASSKIFPQDHRSIVPGV